MWQCYKKLGKECGSYVPETGFLFDLHLWPRRWLCEPGSHIICNTLSWYGDLFVCCFTSQVNSYGHCGMVSSPNHTFSWASLNKQLTSNRAHTFACNWQQPFMNDSAEGRRMTVEIISWSISTKVWDRARIELATPGSAVSFPSVTRHVTDCANLIWWTLVPSLIRIKQMVCKLCSVLEMNMSNICHVLPTVNGIPETKIHTPSTLLEGGGG